MSNIKVRIKVAQNIPWIFIPLGFQKVKMSRSEYAERTKKNPQRWNYISMFDLKYFIGWKSFKWRKWKSCIMGFFVFICLGHFLSKYRLKYLLWAHSVQIWPIFPKYQMTALLKAFLQICASYMTCNSTCLE